MNTGTGWFTFDEVTLLLGLAAACLGTLVKCGCCDTVSCDGTEWISETDVKRLSEALKSMGKSRGPLFDGSKGTWHVH
jgi:hypothetical protein